MYLNIINSLSYVHTRTHTQMINLRLDPEGDSIFGTMGTLSSIDRDSNGHSEKMRKLTLRVKELECELEKHVRMYVCAHLVARLRIVMYVHVHSCVYM